MHIQNTPNAAQYGRRQHKGGFYAGAGLRCMGDECDKCGGDKQAKGTLPDGCFCCNKCGETRHHETGPYGGCNCCECEYRQNLSDAEIQERTRNGTTVSMDF